MKTTTITVPKEKCPLDVLAEMGSQTSGAWIFFTENTAKTLKDSSDSNQQYNDDTYILRWNATAEYPQTSAIIRECDLLGLGIFYHVLLIEATDIAFKSVTAFPDKLLILCMDS